MRSQPLLPVLATASVLSAALVLSTALVLAPALAGTHTAGAHPRRPDADQPIVPRQPCLSTPDWKKFASCQFGSHQIEVLHESATSKLVTYAIDPARGSKRLELYVLQNGNWLKLGLYAETNASTELVAFKPLAGNAYRLDMGFASSTWVTLDEVGSRPAVIRRGYSYVCGATIGCPSVVSSCDLLVHGKSVASFRGAVTWDGRSLRVNGIAQNTNRYCPAPPGLVPPGEVP